MDVNFTASLCFLIVLFILVYDFFFEAKSGKTYDLILMDIMMPVMSGETALKKLKEEENFKTPVLALTADTLKEARERYISQGFIDYIAKPFNKDQIKEKLDIIFK